MNLRLLIATTILLPVLSLPAAAQPSPGDVGVYWDAAGTQGFGFVQDFVVFDFYVVAFDLVGQVRGYEFAVTVPPTMNLLSAELLGPTDPPERGFNIVAGLGGCVDGADALVFARYVVGFFAGDSAGSASNTRLCVGPSTPSSFGGEAPGYLQCDSTLTPLSLAQPIRSFYGVGCLILNPLEVATQAVHFGQIKARY